MSCSGVDIHEKASSELEPEYEPRGSQEEVSMNYLLTYKVGTCGRYTSIHMSSR